MKWRALGRKTRMIVKKNWICQEALYSDAEETCVWGEITKKRSNVMPVLFE